MQYLLISNILLVSHHNHSYHSLASIKQTYQVCQIGSLYHHGFSMAYDFENSYSLHTLPRIFYYLVFLVKPHVDHYLKHVGHA